MGIITLKPARWIIPAFFNIQYSADSYRTGYPKWMTTNRKFGFIWRRHTERTTLPCGFTDGRSFTWPVRSFLHTRVGIRGECHITSSKSSNEPHIYSVVSIVQNEHSAETSWIASWTSVFRSEGFHGWKVLFKTHIAVSYMEEDVSDGPIFRIYRQGMLIDLRPCPAPLISLL